jgi:hypothetical protein
MDWFVFILKSNANHVINITGMLLFLSRATYIWVRTPLCTRFNFGWVIASHDISGPRLRSWSFCFCVSILLLAFYPCIVYPHTGDLTNLAGYPPLKPNIIFVITSLTTTHHWVWIINSRKIVRWCQDWRFQVSLQRKNISGTNLISITSLPEDEKTSKHGGGGRYNAILEFKGSK